MAERIPLILSSIDGEYRIVELPDGDTVPGSGGGVGSQGADGADGAGVGLTWLYNSTLTAPPSDGYVRLNSNTPSLVTKIWINHKDASSRDVESLLDTWDRGYISIIPRTSTNDFFVYTVTGLVQGATYNEYDVLFRATSQNLFSDLLSDDDSIVLTFAGEGTDGTDGSQGAQGPQGHQGSQGYQGDIGSQGPQGAQGHQGYQGDIGSQGSQGHQGHQGAQGFQGDIGAQGSQGYQGHQGAQGYQGDIGSQGSQGDTGSQGYQGNNGVSNGLLFLFDTATDGSLGSGEISFNSTDATAVSECYIDNLDANGNATNALLSRLAAAEGGWVLVQSEADQWNGYAGFEFSAASIDGAGHLTLYTVSGALQVYYNDPIDFFSDDERVIVSFTLYGDTGAQGAQGAQGYQGAQGSQGFQGAIGRQGSQGAQGDSGNDGGTGAQGAQGAQGFQGAQGYQGDIGSQGSQGSQGYQGHQGAQGYQGDIGSQGSQGYQGHQGHQGAQGYQGDIGSQGSQGYQGHQGAQGYQGDIGSQGSQGYQGHQGAQGYQGDIGSQGSQGSQGYQGLAGANGIRFKAYMTTPGTSVIAESVRFDNNDPSAVTRITIADENADGKGIAQLITRISNSESGSVLISLATDPWNNYAGFTYTAAAAVTSGVQLAGVEEAVYSDTDLTNIFNTDDIVNVLFTFDGDTGAQGSQGAQGFQGDIGAQGAQGDDGGIGAQGAQGFQGAQGSAGADGVDGVDGAQGAQGFQGAQGAAGADGVDGAQGAQGAQGFQGEGGSNVISECDWVYEYAGSASTGAAGTGNQGKFAGPNSGDPAIASTFYLNYGDAFASTERDFEEYVNYYYRGAAGNLRIGYVNIRSLDDPSKYYTGSIRSVTPNDLNEVFIMSFIDESGANVATNFSELFDTVGESWCFSFRWDTHAAFTLHQSVQKFDNTQTTTPANASVLWYDSTLGSWETDEAYTGSLTTGEYPLVWNTTLQGYRLTENVFASLTGASNEDLRVSGDLGVSGSFHADSENAIVSGVTVKPTSVVHLPQQYWWGILTGDMAASATSRNWGDGATVEEIYLENYFVWDDSTDELTVNESGIYRVSLHCPLTVATTQTVKAQLHVYTGASWVVRYETEHYVNAATDPFAITFEAFVQVPNKGDKLKVTLEETTATYDNTPLQNGTLTVQRVS